MYDLQDNGKRAGRKEDGDGTEHVHKVVVNGRGCGRVARPRRAVAHVGKEGLPIKCVVHA